MQQIVIYDTTLRDGMQATGINFTLADKLQIARELDKLGIDYIEGGFPLANKKEAEFFNRLKQENFKHAKIAAFGSTRQPNIKAENDPNINALLQAETPAVTVVGKTWKAHVELVLHTSRQENLNMIYDSIATLKKAGREVIFDLEHFFDGYKDDPEYAVQVLKAGTEAGASFLVLCDTNGGTLPGEVSAIMADLSKEKLKPMGAHFHNDCGTAIANSLAAIHAGAIHVQGTVNGWGERAGNANLCVLIPNICLKLKREAYACTQLKHLTALSRFMFEKANIIPDKRQPYVGKAAFSHKAGQHADVLVKAAYLMEHIPSETVGNERRILLSELAGKSTIVKKLSKYGDFDKSANEVKKLVNELKYLEEQGYEYEAAEASFDLIIRRTLNRYTPLLELQNYHLESFKSGSSPAKTVSKLFLKIAGADGALLDKEVMGAAVGLGPVEALDGSLRDALSPHYPFLSHIKLSDYAVRVLDPERAAAARVRVFITSFDGQRSWGTVGVSENIVEASWQALVDSIEYYFNNYVLQNGIS